MTSLHAQNRKEQPCLTGVPEEVAQLIFGFVLPPYFDRANTRCGNEDHQEDCFGVGPDCTSWLSLLFVSRNIRSEALPVYHKSPVIAFLDETDALDLNWLSNFMYVLADTGLLTSKWRFRVNAGASLEMPESELISMILDQERGRRLAHQFFQRTPRLIKEVLGAAIGTAASQHGKSSSARITFEKGRLEGLFHAPRTQRGSISLAWCPLLCLPFTVKAPGLRALRKHAWDPTHALSRAIPRIQLMRMQYDIRDQIMRGSGAMRFGSWYHYPKWTAADSATHPKPDLWLCYSAYRLRSLMQEPSQPWCSDDLRQRIERESRDIDFNDGAEVWAQQAQFMSSLDLDSTTLPELEQDDAGVPIYMRQGARLLFCRPRN